MSDETQLREQIANEIHREARWQAEQGMRNGGEITWGDSVERLLMLESIVRSVPSEDGNQ